MRPNDAQAAYILSCDLGTSAVKAALVTDRGEIEDSETVSYPTRYDGPRAEQNPEDWWKAVCTATHRLTERRGRALRIDVIGVSGHMTGCVPVDARGEALLPFMIHADARAAAQCDEIRRRIGTDALYRMSGNVIDPRSTLSKILWVRQECPEVYAKTARFLQSKDYLTARFTGNIDTTDHSDACHGVLMDLEKRVYRGEVFAELGIDMSRLPTLHRSMDLVGTLTQAAADAMGIQAGVPVIAGGGDGACGSVGAFNLNPGDAYLNLGSTAWIAQVTTAPVIDAEKRLFNIASLDGITNSVYGAMQSGGTSINWIRKMLEIEDFGTLNRMAEAAAPGSGGLVFLPYLNGERSPVFDPNASGVFMGLSQDTTRNDMVRAVMEGTSFALRQIREIIAGNTGGVAQVNAIGGGMASDVWPQMISDIAGIVLNRLSVKSADATSLGIAAAAGTAVGMFDSLEDALSHIHAVETYTPNATVPAVERNYRAYLALYPSLREIMHY